MNFLCQLTCLSIVTAMIVNCHQLQAQDPPDPLSKLRVSHAQNAATGKSVVGIGDILEVTVDGLAEYLNTDHHHSIEKISLFLDSRPFPSLTARRVSVSGVDQNKLRFDLRLVKSANPESNPPNLDSWDALLGAPSNSPGAIRKIKATVGIDNRPVDSIAELHFLEISGGWAGSAIAIAVLVTISLIYCGITTSLLRDCGPASPFSLGRVQGAVWFWTVLVSFLFIWSVIGDTSTMTGQVLGILGLSSMTFVSAVGIESRNNRIDTASTRDSKQDLAAKSQRIAEINAQPLPLPPALTAELGTLTTAVTELNNAIQTADQRNSRRLTPDGFFNDILTDDKGLSFHRFQFCAWTVVLVIIFLQQVWRRLSMPDLDPSLLTLMGISSGTYVAMKNTEKNTP